MDPSSNVPIDREQVLSILRGFGFTDVSEEDLQSVLHQAMERLQRDDAAAATTTATTAHLASTTTTLSPRQQLAADEHHHRSYQQATTTSRLAAAATTTGTGGRRVQQQAGGRVSGGADDVDVELQHHSATLSDRVRADREMLHRRANEAERRLAMEEEQQRREEAAAAAAGGFRQGYAATADHGTGARPRTAVGGQRQPQQDYRHQRPFVPEEECPRVRQPQFAARAAAGTGGFAPPLSARQQPPSSYGVGGGGVPLRHVDPSAANARPASAHHHRPEAGGGENAAAAVNTSGISAGRGSIGGASAAVRTGVLYASMGAKTYLAHCRAPHRTGGVRERNDPVSKGARMRRLWERDTFLTKKDENAMRWHVRQSLMQWDV